MPETTVFVEIPKGSRNKYGGVVVKWRWEGAVVLAAIGPLGFAERCPPRHP